MKKMKRILALLLSLVLVFSIVGCTKKSEQVETPETPDKGETQEKTEEVEKEKSEIKLSTTTSTQDSGLLDYLLPIFTEDTGVEVSVIAVGTGQALQMGKDGEADVLLVHAKASEEEFVAEGHGSERFEVMYNDFVLVGPLGDMDWKLEKSNDIAKALGDISRNKAIFVSRGDDSGTHKKELSIWKSSEIEPEGQWYLEAGSGMGDVLKLADEKQGYTLTDRATYLSMKDDLELEIYVEGDKGLFNQYGIIPVNPEKNEVINNEGAMELVNWITGEKGQGLIKEFGVEEYGQGLFIPNAK